MHKLGEPKPRIINIQMDEMAFDVYVDGKGEGAISSNLRKEYPKKEDFLRRNSGPRLVHCDNCNWTGKESTVGKDMMRMSRLWDRLEPGGEVPAGECPKCAGCVYLNASKDFEDAYEEVRRWNEFVAALEALVLSHAIAGINIEHEKYIEGLHNAYLSGGKVNISRRVK